MKNNINIAGVLAGLFFGFVLGYFIKSDTNTNINSDHHTSTDMEHTMEEMSHNLHDLKGDEFDQGFLKDMIDHHDGAIHMAEHALENSNRAEIKELAKKILVEQSKEVAQMKLWQKGWTTQY